MYVCKKKIIKEMTVYIICMKSYFVALNLDLLYGQITFEIRAFQKLIACFLLMIKIRKDKIEKAPLSRIQEFKNLIIDI